MSNQHHETPDQESIRGIASPEISEEASAVQETREQVQSVTEVKTRPLPKGLYRLMALGALVVAGHGAYELYSHYRLRDNRSTEEVTREVLHARRRLSPNKTGDVTKEMVKRTKELAECQMKKMNFEPSDAPSTPVEPEAPKSNDPRVLWEYRQKNANYKYEVLTLDKRKKLWEENNKTRDEFVLVPLPNDYGKEYLRFSRWSNLDSFVGDDRVDMMVGLFKQMAKNLPEWKDQLGWMWTGFQAYQKDHPNQKNKDGKIMSEDELFKQYVIEVYLGQPLDCPRWADGECMRSWEGTTLKDGEELSEARKKGDKAKMREIQKRGRICLLLKPLADGVTRANRWMYDARKGEEIEPMTCFRSDFEQAVLWVSLAGGGCSLTREHSEVDVQLPGLSNHGSAGGADIWNWKEAQPYLAIETGMLCNFVSRNDRSHCSIAEAPLSKRNILRKKALDLLAQGKEIKDVLKEGGRAIIEEIF